MKFSRKINKIKRYRKTKKQFGGNCKQIDKVNDYVKKISVEHPMSKFIRKKIGDKYFLSLHKGNNNLLDVNNMYVNCFLEKMLEILQFSFSREREYHISIGNYPDGYQHSLNNIISNLKSSSYITYILTDLNLTPLSFLYIELKNNDYDKMWTVCSDKNHRGEGNSSLVVKNSLRDLKKNKRNRVLLEVYNDDVIGRKDDDPRQEHIMSHFLNQGFKHKERSELSDHTRNNLLSPREETKVMVLEL